MADRVSPDFPEYNRDTAGVWDRLAEWWDDRIGDGNATQDVLVEPTQERLLDLRAGERVLDVACGAGRFTRRMARAGAMVVAGDRSARFIERARRRTPSELAGRIDYRLLDATDAAAILELAPSPFDAVLLNTFTEAGLVVDRLEEPSFPPPAPDSPPAFGWSHLAGIPQVLVARLVRPPAALTPSATG